MKPIKRGWRRLLGSLFGSRRERELDDEFESHIAMQTEDNVRAGMTPEEARRAALITFGGISPAKDSYRDQRGLPWLETTVADIRYAARGLRASPGFAMVVLLTLAVGIGANTAIFSLVNQVLLHPPGVSDPGRIVVVGTRYEKLTATFSDASGATFASTRDSRDVFERTGAQRWISLNYTGGQTPERISAAAVSVEWFEVFGARPQLGRLFSPEEDQPNGGRVLLLSHAGWIRLFGGDRRVIGRKVEFNQVPYEIVGVMSPDFRQPSVDAWVPLALPAEKMARQNRFNEDMNVFARMRPGITFEQADAFLKLSARRAIDQAPARVQTYARDAGWGLLATRFTDSNAGRTKTPMLILSAAVGLVLLIACSNIAGLMLARSSARARELGVRAALGASRGRLLRQLLSESLLLAAAGGAAGLLLAVWLANLLLRLAGQGAPDSIEQGITSLDPYVLVFAAAASMASGIFFSLAPAWQLLRADPHESLKNAARNVAGSARQRLRSTLVIAEAALALVLLVAAGLFLRSFEQLQEVNPGFEPRGVVIARYSLPEVSYKGDPQRDLFARTVLERLRQANGVTAAAIGRPVPFSNEGENGSFQIEGRTIPAGETFPQSARRWVTADYLKALRIPLQRGRFFTEQDQSNTELVAVIDAKLARTYWPDEDPVGKRIQVSLGPKWFTIVGVAGTVRENDLAKDDRGVVYMNFAQQPMPLGTIVVRTSGDSAAASSAIRDAVRAVDPRLPLSDVRPLAEWVARSLATRLFLMRLLAFFGAMALFLAALGLYGVINYSVTQRTREIGVRMALGAERSAVMKLVVGQGLRLAMIGVALGIVGAALANRLIQSQLYQVSAGDPLTIAATAGTLLVAALLACYLPARRAVRVDPVVTLRYE